MTQRFLTLLLLSCLVVTLVVPTRGQQVANQAPASVDEKTQPIIDKAVQALGGPSYLSVTTVISRGFYTSFHDGASQLPAQAIATFLIPVTPTVSGSVVNTAGISGGGDPGCPQTTARCEATITTVLCKLRTSSARCAPVLKICCVVGGKKKAARSFTSAAAKRAWRSATKLSG